MILYILKKFFRIIIGDLPPEKRAMLWNRFVILLEDVAKAVAEGAVAGAMKK